MLQRLALQKNKKKVYILRTKTHHQAVKKHWKAYLILLQYNNHVFNQSVILHFLSKCLFCIVSAQISFQLATPYLSRA